MQNARQQGFTLIELSIVLVIIGLIVGAVLVGQNLIAAAGVRATISQIEKYQTATNTFRDKYGGIPGDINASTATQFGFAPRGPYEGQGDGNGVLEGNCCNANSNVGNSGAYGTCIFIGETAMFWVDLSQAGLIDGGFNSATSTVKPSMLSTNAIAANQIGLVLPEAKLGNGNYVYVWSGGTATPGVNNSTNYFGIEGISSSGDGIFWRANVNVIVNSSPYAMTVQQAYAMDSKMDDGLPQSGNVMAVGTGDGSSALGYWSNMQNTPSATSCFDTSSKKYSIQTGGGAGPNCALSFRFQ